VGNPTSCGRAGHWAEPPALAISGGSFATHVNGAAEVNPDQIDVRGTFTSRSTATVTFTISCLRSSGRIVQTRSFTATTDAPPPAHCGSARIAGGALELGASAAARAHPKRYRRRGAIRIQRRGTDCAAVEQVMDTLLRARDESAALLSSGYVMTRFKRLRVHGRRAYRVTARGVGAGGSIGYVRYGSALPIDHSIYRAGQQVFMDEGTGTHLLAPCMAAFAVLDPQVGAAGLSAGHCGAPAPQSTGLEVERAYLPNARSRLGAVLRGAQESGFDGLEYSIDGRWGVAQQIERGELPPLTVLGVVDDISIGRGTRVCFAGRTSGADTCGRVKGFRQHLRCIGPKARPGDSGGPVYYDPGGGLTTRAVGIVATAGMCFTPLSRVPARFGVTFPPGPFVR
jgi:hypothetical protein